MFRTLTHAAIVIAAFSPVVFGQDNAAEGDSIASIQLPHGLHIYGASVYSGYMTTAYPSGGPCLEQLVRP